MSDMARARLELDEARREMCEARKLAARAMRRLETAQRLMVRASPVKRSKAERVAITPSLRLRVKELKAKGISHHKIANMVGLPNGGRVSEIVREMR